MPGIRDAIRYPAKRVLLQRTRLAYVHLRNLLTDAKRDRAARVAGYVACWLPEELICLYLEEGEVVNATTSSDGFAFSPIAISDAIGRVPTAAEYGSICFHEADNEQLDLMYASQTREPLPWPRELDVSTLDPIISYLHGTMHDGAVELMVDGMVNFVSVSSGQISRGYFVDPRPGEPVALMRGLLHGGAHATPPVLRLWPTPDPLPAQASPALIQAYRELMGALTARLESAGKAHASEVSEGARRALVQKHPTLDRFSPALERLKDPVTDANTLTKAIGAWVADILWAAAPDDVTPEDLLRELTASRRHVFQSAGLYDALPWKVKW
ncbi:MAG: hypothetical protein KF709_12515 [Gemmatimonadaceae bacterium]|nr:hypothetical protein [Gemmatimonadaceae bacterium]